MILSSKLYKLLGNTLNSSLASIYKISKFIDKLYLFSDSEWIRWLHSLRESGENNISDLMELFRKIFNQDEAGFNQEFREVVEHH